MHSAGLTVFVLYTAGNLLEWPAGVNRLVIAGTIPLRSYGSHLLDGSTVSNSVLLASFTGVDFALHPNFLLLSVCNLRFTTLLQ